ncbi:MAG: prepilin-type N-terminal cleavage/methylation domain-containing protein [Lachnospiraceae bacterium]|nr:prepilin-type N-terminal cleavage/methylation domain-containing protein [Lachnospiraceae bacterium]
MRKNNKGYSLTELIITLAIFSIIMLAIIMMMRTSLVSYKNGIQETTMQEEAQIVANQVEDMLVDATYIDTIDPTPGAEKYTFVGPEGTFTIQHIGHSLYYSLSGVAGSQLLSDQVTLFKLDGLTKRPTTDTTTIYDNAVTVVVGVEYEGREYTASKEAYFRNNVEDRSTLTEEKSPFDVEAAPISGGGGNPNPSTTAEKVVRYKPYDISAEYDIIANAVLSTDAQMYFELVESNNSTIKTTPTGMSASDVKHYKVKVKDTYQTVSGFGIACPVGTQVITVTGKNSKNQDVTVYLQMEAVTVKTSGMFVDYNMNDVNDNGFPTHVEVTGIDINEAIKAGCKIKYDVELKKGATSKGKATGVELKKVDSGYGNKAGDVPQLGSFDLKLGLTPDPINGGFIITSSNGYRYDQKDSKKQMTNADGNQQLIFSNFRVQTPSQTEQSCDLFNMTLKYYVAGTSFEKAN